MFEVRWYVHWVISSRWEHCNGSNSPEPCDQVRPRLWHGRTGGWHAPLHWSVTARVNCQSLHRSGLSCAAGSSARGIKNPTTKELEELKRVGRYLRSRPVGSGLNHKPFLELWRCSSTQASLETLERAGPDLEWRSRGVHTC